jgi:hypothetical protein
VVTHAALEPIHEIATGNYLPTQLPLAIVWPYSDLPLRKGLVTNLH